MTQIYKDKAAQLTYEIMQLYREDHGPFPYVGCRFILQGLETEFEDFIPDLNLWSMDIAGFASQSFKIKQWPGERIKQTQGLMSLGFFDKHPEYHALERLITSEEAPDLYGYLRLYEKIREKLEELLFSLIRAEGIIGEDEA